MSGVVLSVIFPVYNEEENVPILLDEIARVLRPRGITFEMIAINDGSRDRSLEVLRQEQQKYPELRVLSLARNSGQSAALDAGFRAARGELVVSLDSDLQNDPADIPMMIDLLRSKNVDMVIGVRVNRRDTAWKRIQSKIGNGVRNWLTNDQVTDTGCSLKLIKRAALDRVRLFSGMHRFLPTLVKMNGFTVLETAVNHRERRFGTSKYNALNRAFRGLADCLAVRWMQKRNFVYEVSEEQKSS